MELSEMGPSLDLEVRRSRQPPVDLEKEACKQPKLDKKKVGAARVEGRQCRWQHGEVGAGAQDRMWYCRGFCKWQRHVAPTHPGGGTGCGAPALWRYGK